MSRPLTSLWLALALGALGAACAKDVATSSNPAISTSLGRGDGAPVSIAVIGDVPYGQAVAGTGRAKNRFRSSPSTNRQITIRPAVAV